MQDGGAVEEKVRESLESWRVVSSPLLEVFKRAPVAYIGGAIFLS